MFFEKKTLNTRNTNRLENHVIILFYHCQIHYAFFFAKLRFPCRKLSPASSHSFILLIVTYIFSPRFEKMKTAAQSNVSMHLKKNLTVYMYDRYMKVNQSLIFHKKYQLKITHHIAVKKVFFNRDLVGRIQASNLLFDSLICSISLFLQKID